MTLFLMKLTLTPLLMWLVTVASRRWGTDLGGLIAGLPLTSGPISIYLFLEQGRAFAAHAAVSSLISVAAVSWFSIGYGRVADRKPAACCAIFGLLFFAASALILDLLRPRLFGALVFALLSIGVALIAIPRPRRAVEQLASPAWDLPARILTATALVVFVTVGAAVLGPGISGLLSPIPVVAWPLCFFAHVQQGPAAASRVLRGIAKGAFGVCIFYTIVALGIRKFDPALVYLVALLGAVLTSLPWLYTVRPAKA
jgi:hypothetical protein